MVRNMTKGSPVKLLLAFALPLLVANVFQQLYSVADAMVLGRGVGVNALAAAGSTGSVHFFIFGFINGLTHGYSILISQRFGAGDESDMRRTVMNAGYLGFMSAAVITALSLIFSRPLMTLMGTPTDIFDDALLYIRIIFIGIFTTVFYNTLSSILRALGDSMSPLIIILISSAVNIGLDILFVMAFKWGVAGAAWATVLAQLLSGLMCLFVLRRMPVLRFKAGEKRMDKSIIFGLLKLGLPVGIMNSITAIGGMILQGVVNSLGSTIVAAYTAGSKIFGLAEQPCNIIGLSLGTYVGQNLGAGRIDRIKVGVRRGILMVLIVDFFIGGAMILFGRQLLSIYTSDAEVISLGMVRLVVMNAAYFTCGIMNVFPGITRGMGQSLAPMICTLVGACLLRVVWIMTVFAWKPTIMVLYLCYPVSWAITGAGQLLIYRRTLGRLTAEMKTA